MFNPNIKFDIPKEHSVIGGGPASPFYLDGWLKWNEEVWGLKAHRVLYTNGKSEYPRLEGVLYTDKKGRVIQPPRNPYLPFRFVSTNTNVSGKIYSQYIDLMNLFAKDLLKRCIVGIIMLPPGFIDARPFQWNGFTTSLRYTFMQDLNQQYEHSKHVNKNINKALKEGYVVEASNDWNAISYCLSGTEKVKGFSHLTSIEDLKKCEKFLGADVFRGYLVKNETGEPVSGGLRLVLKNGITIDWSQGAFREHLKNGVNQLLYAFVLDDIKKRGSVMFDWVGANIPEVALAKSAWGAPLVPYLTIRQKNFRYVGSVCKEYLKNTIKSFK